MNSKDIFAQLLRRLIQQSVFYVPNEEVDEKVRSMFDVSLDPYIGTLSYFSGKGSVKPLLLPKHLQKMITKRQILDENIFDISDFRDDLSKPKFDLIINKYILWLNACCFYSEAMLNDIYTIFPNSSENEYLAFKYQHLNFLEHRESTLEICNIVNSKPYSIDDLLLLSDVSTIDFKPNVSYDLSNEILYEPKVFSTPNINEQNIERFLLESVFNIKST